MNPITLNAGEQLVAVRESDGTCTATVLYAGVHFLAALDACERMRGDKGRSSDAASAIMSAAAAAEAFISELAYVADQATTVELRSGREHPRLETFAAVMLSDGEASRVNLRSRFLVAKLLLTAKAYSKGSQPFQDFSFLVDLRNCLAHLKPTSIEDTVGEASIIGGLQTRNLVVENHPSLLGNVMTFQVARFACNSASSIIRDMHDSCPIPEASVSRLTVAQTLEGTPNLLDVLFPFVAE